MCLDAWRYNVSCYMWIVFLGVVCNIHIHNTYLVFVYTLIHAHTNMYIHADMYMRECSCTVVDRSIPKNWLTISIHITCIYIYNIYASGLRASDPPPLPSKGWGQMFRMSLPPAQGRNACAHAYIRSYACICMHMLPYVCTCMCMYTYVCICMH